MWQKPRERREDNPRVQHELPTLDNRTFANPDGALAREVREIIASPFVRRALAGELPAKVVR